MIKFKRDKVVYLEKIDRDIFMYDITTKKIKLINPYSSNLNNPHMYSNKVI